MTIYCCAGPMQDNHCDACGRNASPVEIAEDLEQRQHDLVLRAGSDPQPELWVDGKPNPAYTAWMERNKPKDLGPSSDFGWQECHGCGVDSDMWGDPRTKHRDDCPGVCIRPTCTFHSLVICPQCHGTGSGVAFYVDDKSKCTLCLGEGAVSRYSNEELLEYAVTAVREAWVAGGRTWTDALQADFEKITRQALGMDWEGQP